ncbi:MAG: gamma-glutamylcyclotransferase [Alphaproteobacteria bacterium]|nr:gamma-glutamylcyclotransferase [Alphaproteobacteria bacterium]
MLLPDEAFAHVPELHGQITPPESSQFRMSHAVIERWDGFAAAIGLPPTWRYTHDEREARRRAALAGWLDSDLWVFAYGAVMWDPGFHAVEIRRARVPGWQRRFNLLVPFGRGTPEQPCLQGGLTEGGACDGLAFRIPAEAADRETEILCMRELVCEGYAPRFLTAETPQGLIEALAFTSDPDCPANVELGEAETARIIATAAGVIGPNRDYLDNIVLKLAQLGIDDPATARLAALCTEIAAGG